MPDSEGLVRALRSDGREAGAEIRDGLACASLPAGRWRFTARLGRLVSAPAEIDVAEGATVETSVVLGDGAVIEGVVVDETGAPRADVRFRVPTDPLHGSGPDGRFRLLGLDAGPAEIVLGERGATGPRHAMLWTAQAPSKDARIVYPRPTRLRFRLRAPDGSPRAGPVTCTLLVPESLITASDCRADVLDPLPDGAYEVDVGGATTGVSIEVKGHGSRVLRATSSPGKVVDLGTIDLPPPRRLRGVVRDFDGRPVVGARVDALDVTCEAWGGNRATDTSRDGSFELLDESGDAAWLQVDAPSRPTVWLPIARGADVAAFEVQVPRGVWVRGVVLAPDGRPARFPAISPRPPVLAGLRTDERFRTSDVLGRFRVLTAGGRVRVAASEFDATGFADVDAAPGTEPDIVIRLQR